MGTQKTARPIHRRHVELDSGEAFVHDFRRGFVPIDDDDVEAVAEEFIAGATSNESVAEIARDEVYAEETSGFLFEGSEEDALLN